ncbi:glycosyltransferase [Arenibaculum pallidiluteum]|uniref:glycosyltransferase n=1 Tax=Arenibaculum pallidiluteum TaxID=2812559 RepID=UPI001A978983|nr:glycosyltransferase [Arenibaculum pallidiluteum]
MNLPLAFTWSLSEMHGWGLVGVHAALYLAEIGEPPLLLEKPALSTLRPLNRERLGGLVSGYERMMALAAAQPGGTLAIDADVLHALGNGFEAGGSSERFRGRHSVAVVAFEDTRMDGAIRARAGQYERMIVHSTYNKALLEAEGLPDVRLTFQGIDPTEMGPMAPSRRFGDRFVVFSGGKLEFRKGQDIVLAAFKRFHARHPDALLVTAWHNPWPATAMNMAESPLAAAPPRVGADGRLDIRAWAAENGVPQSAFVDLGFIGRDSIAPVLADCHAAVFPNRCEGATNLVAMEALACGVPTILSANTGHLDLLGRDIAFPLADQSMVPDAAGARIGWGESSVDELVEVLETVRTDTAEARRRAERAITFMKTERTWRSFAESFVAACRG